MRYVGNLRIIMW